MESGAASADLGPATIGAEDGGGWITALVMLGRPGTKA